MYGQEEFLAFVMAEAEKIGKLFILDTSEGRDLIDPKTGWYIEDLSGWLVDFDKKEQFLQHRKNETAYEDFSEAYVFAKWSQLDNGEIIIKFSKH